MRATCGTHTNKNTCFILRCFLFMYICSFPFPFSLFPFSFFLLFFLCVCVGAGQFLDRAAGRPSAAWRVDHGLLAGSIRGPGRGNGMEFAVNLARFGQSAFQPQRVSRTSRLFSRTRTQALSSLVPNLFYFRSSVHSFWQMARLWCNKKASTF